MKPKGFVTPVSGYTALPAPGFGKFGKCEHINEYEILSSYNDISNSQITEEYPAIVYRALIHFLCDFIF